MHLLLLVGIPELRARGFRNTQLDTNIASELRKPKPHGGVVAWVAANDSASPNLYAKTIAELQRGVEMTREQDADKANQIEAWLEQLMFTGQVLAMDAAVCREWARLMHRRSDTPVEDVLSRQPRKCIGLLSRRATSAVSKLSAWKR